MHVIITDPWLARSRAYQLSGWQLLGVLAAFSLASMSVALALYHSVFVHGARQGWPIVTPFVELVTSQEKKSQERFIKENLDSMARKLGDLQARLVQLDALGERVSALAGLQSADKPKKPGAGGPLRVTGEISMNWINQALTAYDRDLEHVSDLLDFAETRLFADRMKKSMLPTAFPVPGVEPGSGFGWRMDPVTGQRALHTGLDFAADTGTPIVAAAGGVVVTQEFHVAYGNMVELDHGNDLITRYAHASRTSVKVGDIVKRGQVIAYVGSTGRSTGPHLHFEVWLRGVAQDPQFFLRATAEAQQVSSRALAGTPVQSTSK